MLKCWNSKERKEKQRPIHGDIIYTGYTNNIFRRLKEHIKGQSTYTKRFHGNILLGYLEAYDNRKMAMKMEQTIKSFSRDKKVGMIQEFEAEKGQYIKYIMQKVYEKLL
jgi:putative endonuclease